MKHLQRGFTIVELIVVMITIGIIITIGLNFWINAANGAKDKARTSETEAWAGAFNVYKGRFGVYPALPTGDNAAGAVYLCLGAKNGKCGQFSSSTTSQYIDATASGTTTMLSNLQKVGTLPASTAPVLGNQWVGPLVAISQSTDSTTGNITVTGKFIDFFQTGCPTGYTDETSSSDPNLATILPIFSGLSTYGKACSLAETFTYNAG